MPATPHALVVTLVAVLLGALPPRPSCAQEALRERPRILLTNDDGITSAGLHALRRALEPLGEVVVSAPATNESGASHSVRALRGFAVWPHHQEGAVVGWAVNGTPSDAVRFGLLELGRDRAFDLVVSGINDGANLGVIAHYSGTVGAAMEAALHNTPAIAVSQARDVQDYEAAIRTTVRIARAILAGRGPSPGIVLNVNVPPEPMKGVVVLPMGRGHLGVRGFERVGEAGDTVTWRTVLEAVPIPPGQSDTRAFGEGWIVVTPLLFDRTAHEWLAPLAEWEWEARK